MKAIRVHEAGGPEVMHLEDIPDPQPEAGQVLIRVYAAGVNPVDTYIRAGSYTGVKHPYTPGADAAGVAEAAGEAVSGISPGQRVYTSGTVTGAYAEKTLCEASQVHPLPDRISFSQGAGVNIPYATAYRALFQRAHGLPGETVLVHGATGGVGIASVQIARVAGFIVIGTGGTESGRNLVREQGAHYVFDHTSAGYLDEIMSVTGGLGVDVILEMLANVNLSKDLGLLATGGRVAVIGSRGTVEIDPRLTMAREAEVLGVMLAGATPAQSAGIHAALVAGLENGTLTPIVAQEIPLSEAPRAHEAVMGAGHHGKIVLVP